MPIGKASVEKVFLLSRLASNEEEIEKFSTQLDAVLDYMDTLNKVDTDQVEPVGNIAGLSNVFRDDQVAGSLEREAVLANAPSEDGETFKVPKVF